MYDGGMKTLTPKKKPGARRLFGERMVKSSTVFSVELKDRLDTYAIANGLSLAEVIRKACEMYLRLMDASPSGADE